MPQRRVDVALEAGASIAECPSWDPSTETLLWVDMLRGEVHRYSPTDGTDVVERTGSFVAAAVTREAGGLLVAEADEVLLIDRQGAVETSIPVVHRHGGIVLNDGRCDHLGRFWFGSASEASKRQSGRLYRLDGDLTLQVAIDQVGISNGLDWSPDGGSMYYVDSATQRVDVFEFDERRGVLSGRRPLTAVPKGLGEPDGLTVDSEGFIWVAIWGGGRIWRLSPEGELADVIEIPLANATNCAFGGAQLETLFITAAGDDEGNRRNGAIFVLEPGIRGRNGVGFRR